jgi:DNA-binding transcriptional LysR family regulator
MSVKDQELQADEYPATHAGLKPHEAVSEQISHMNLTAISYFYDSRLALILSGKFIGFLPEQYAEPYLDRGDIMAVAPSERSYTLGVAVICKKTTQPNKPRELFLKVLHQTVEELIAAPY